jgi:hypothetical protein
MYASCISSLATRLLATGDAKLVEGNTSGDRFWGVCRGQGGINSANCSWNAMSSCGAALLPSRRLAELSQRRHGRDALLQAERAYARPGVGRRAGHVSETRGLATRSAGRIAPG